MDIAEALAHVADGNDLEAKEMRSVMRQLMSGEAHDAQIGGFLTALRIKGETVSEISASVEVMRELVTTVPVCGEDLIDIVGTGGDGSNLFNVSTAAGFVVAAAGGRVAKHGNRSVSSRSGSADFLQAAGVNIDLNPSQVADCIKNIGIGFMFAPKHHSAMKYAAGPRKAIRLRTIFNILGPMTNPAGVVRQLIGVYTKRLCAPMAEVLGSLGAQHVMVVHSEDGLDEISIAAPTDVAEYRKGSLSEYRLRPEDFFEERQSLHGLTVVDSLQSFRVVEDALGARNGKQANAAGRMIALNAGAALYVAGLADNIRDGYDAALEVIYSGLAKTKIDQLASYTQAKKVCNG